MSVREQETGGGPAFPTNNGPDRFNSAGMSLRDWFAGQALVGLLNGVEPGAEFDDEDVAKLAYELADAVLKARLAKATENR